MKFLLKDFLFLENGRFVEICWNYIVQVHLHLPPTHGRQEYEIKANAT